MIDVIVTIFIIIVLIALSGFFSSTETAFISVNRIKMMQLSEKGNKNAKVLYEELNHPERFITTILVGNNIVNIAASVITTALALQLFGDKGIAIATGILTIVILIFGEIVPKTFATRHADEFALKTVNILQILTKIMQPLIFIFSKITYVVFKVLGIKEKRKNPLVSEDHIKLLMMAGEREGVFEKHEIEYVKNIFEFTDEYAENIMTYRKDLVCMENTEMLDHAIVKINESGHTRLPVWMGNEDNIIGMIHAKDLIGFKQSVLSQTTAECILRPIMIVRMKQKIASIFREFQLKKLQIAIVVDKNKKVVGIISIEDILEEIVGEIVDEYDFDEIDA